MNAEEINEKLIEIELLQKEVNEILFKKNWFMKMLLFRKAIRLHLLAQKKIDELLNA